MSETKIEWTDQSSNPLRAYHTETGKRGWFCVHVSAGCAHCYAERMNRWVGSGLLYRAQDRRLVEFKLDLDEMRSWKKLPAGTKVFAFDMTDIYQEGVPDDYLHLVYAAFAQAPHVTFQILTKRPERRRLFITAQRWPRPLPNVWEGTSVEDQATADERVPELLNTPAAVRFVSYEPALGPVDFTRLRDDEVGATWNALDRGGLDWIIAGGESGPGARPFDVAWARFTVEQCKAAGCAAFVKQLGARPFDSGSLGHERHMLLLLKNKKGGDMSEWPEDLRVREFPAPREER